jgi:Type I phosphodiesterase / nucleotide pyrophosphatase
MEASVNPASITGFRSRLRRSLEEARSAGRNVVILAIDGLPYDLAVTCWPHAEVSRMRSVFPSTSSSAWLSSLTGAAVHDHGIPGVVFKVLGGEVVNVFEYRGDLGCPSSGNIFSDAAGMGYEPLAVVGDWEPYNCSWRDELLRHSRPVFGHRFYTSPDALRPAALVAAVERALAACRDTQPSGGCLIWCFIDADRRIHRHGYDVAVIDFIRRIDGLACELLRQGALVLAHSDHGLVRTRHRPGLARFLAGLQAEYGCALGGAGRTRWLYTLPATAGEVLASLARNLPASVRLSEADSVFVPGSLARARVGDIVLIADGEEFTTFSGHSFDHGSCTEAEMNVPFARWLP